jgi:hypothetical protein
MDFTVTQRFRCTPTEYWARSRGGEFDRALAQASQVEFEALPARGNVERSRITQIGELPAVAQKALGARRFCYVQEVEEREAEFATAWRILPEVMADRVICSGTTRIRPAADGCERVVTGTIAVKIPLVGGTIERYIGDTVQAGYQRAESTIRRFVEQK